MVLNECIEAGLDSAIAHSSKILPMNRIDERQREVALDMVYDRRRGDDHPDGAYDPLQTFMELFDGVSAADAKDARAEKLAALPLFDRLAQRIIDGERTGIETDLDAGMKEKDPLAIVNEDLLRGMQTVGELLDAQQLTALVELHDRGALDWIIRARLETALARAQEADR